VIKDFSSAGIGTLRPVVKQLFSGGLDKAPLMPLKPPQKIYEKQCRYGMPYAYYVLRVFRT
jgi:hypothetical protein